MTKTLGRFVPPALSSAPSSPDPGEIYYDLEDQEVYVWAPTLGIWRPLAIGETSVARGSATISGIGASPQGDSSAIAHGLAGAPTSVVATVDHSASTVSSPNQLLALVGSIGPSTFTIRIRHVGGTNIGTGNVVAKWLAMI